MCYRAPILYVMPFILLNGLQILVEVLVLTGDSHQTQYTFKYVRKIKSTCNHHWVPKETSTFDLIPLRNYSHQFYSQKFYVPIFIDLPSSFQSQEEYLL